MWAALLTLAIGAEPEILHVPADAVVHALADAATLPEERRPFVRYVWTDGTKKENAAVSFAVNTAVSKASIPVRCPEVAGGRLVRIELDTLLPKDADLKRGLELWEKQAGQDPWFYVRQQVKTAAYLADDGKTYDWRWGVSFGSWVDLKSAVMLQGLTKSAAPITRADFFIVRTLTQQNGGQYFAWAGIRKSQKAGRTDFEQFLEDHGVNRSKSEELNASRRSALKRSGVTRKPRAIQEENGPNGTVVWTEDVAKGNTNAASDPFKELEKPKKDAIEAIALRPNGFCSFGTFDGEEKLVDVVPEVIAEDTTQPDGFGILEAGMSCIRCHGIGQGFRVEKNDFAKMLRSKPRDGVKLDLFGSEKEEDQRAFIDRVASKYRGNLTRLAIARDTYSDAVFLATGGESVQGVAETIGRIDDDFRFHSVTAQKACRDLGVEVSEEDALKTLRLLLPPETAPGGREDDDLGALLDGIEITTEAWIVVLPDALLRSRPAYEKLAKEQVKK